MKTIDIVVGVAVLGAAALGAVYLARSGAFSAPVPPPPNAQQQIYGYGPPAQMPPGYMPGVQAPVPSPGVQQTIADVNAGINLGVTALSGGLKIVDQLGDTFGWF